MDEIIEEYQEKIDENYEFREVRPVRTGLFYVWSDEDTETHIVSPITEEDTFHTVRKDVICNCDDYDGSCVHRKAVQEAIDRQDTIDGDGPATRANLRKAQYSLKQISDSSE
ncbi:hypothetical protein JMJ58_03700 [Haloterrigena salifodinae]|uniref:SWIM-type domain-containing protein n=1 Tax=Haloterrigena salifodinae TaxID=2675099 RepID=A0A8T8E384_9EURY|nr:hypothetical protein [Haloterrigena salifodinae]QRV16013.1 hypothetical protein JMJ58_03700 [Haloterrigena salifodinae]